MKIGWEISCGFRKPMNLEILRRSSENAAGRPAYAFPRVPRGVRAMPVKQQPRVLRGDGFYYILRRIEMMNKRIVMFRFLIIVKNT